MDALRYVAMSRPEASKPPTDEERKFIEMEKRDPASAREWKDWERKCALRSQKNPLGDAFAEDTDGPKDLPGAQYDWSD